MADKSKEQEQQPGWFDKLVDDVKVGWETTKERAAYGYTWTVVKIRGTWVRFKIAVRKAFGIKREKKQRPPSPPTPSPQTVMHLERIGLGLKRILGWGGEIVAVQCGEHLCLKFRWSSPMARWCLDHLPAPSPPNEPEN